MPYAIRLEKQDVLRWTEVPLPEPQAGEILIRHTAISVNYIDIYHRKGIYPLPLPSGIGLAAAGVVERVGEHVKTFRVGDRVGYTSGPVGAYAEFHCVKAAQAVKIPDDIDGNAVAALILRGLTAWYLLHKTYPVRKGDVIAVPAAAGGTGQLLCRWGKALGATVIGLVGSDAKTKIAQEAGADHVFSSREPFAAKIKALSGGAGAHVVYDGVGKDTFDESLASLRPRGMLALFGAASGAVPPFDLQRLSAGGSLFLTRPSLTSYISTPEELQEGASALWQAIRADIALPQITATYALKDAAQAQAALESRETTGALILLPQQ